MGKLSTECQCAQQFEVHWQGIVLHLGLPLVAPARGTTLAMVRAVAAAAATLTDHVDRELVTSMPQPNAVSLPLALSIGPLATERVAPQVHWYTEGTAGSLKSTRDPGRVHPTAVPAPTRRTRIPGP